MLEPLPPQVLAQFQVRLALPQDRRQIRLLLREYHHCRRLTIWRCLGWRCLGWRYFGLGLGFAWVLHWLLIVGGLQLLSLGLLVLGSLGLAGWVNLRLADWRHYWVIEQERQLVACAKLTCYQTYAVLSDVVVAVNWRQLGVGSRLLTAIAQGVNLPIYLACRPELAGFYQRLGFHSVCPQTLSAYLRQELDLQNSQLKALCRLHSTDPELGEKVQK
jgi:N-acetylglutamate synthase-like GNAT family acetyltransferase